jgi:hypothetical protein
LSPCAMRLAPTHHVHASVHTLVHTLKRRFPLQTGLCHTCTHLLHFESPRRGEETFGPNLPSAMPAQLPIARGSLALQVPITPHSSSRAAKFLEL